MIRNFTLYNSNLQPINEASEAAGVLDHETRLMWSTAAFLAPSLEAAREYVKGLNTFGQVWRLPTRAELISLIDDTRVEPATFLQAFGSTPTDEFYWSGSQAIADIEAYWFVDFHFGAVNVAPPTMKGYVRAVRV